MLKSKKFKSKRNSFDVNNFIDPVVGKYKRSFRFKCTRLKSNGFGKHNLRILYLYWYNM